jgi:hypothetical protein
LKKSDVRLLKGYLYGLPVLGLAALITRIDDFQAALAASGSIKILYDLFGLMVAIWMALTVYLGMRLLLSERFREEVLSKITFIKERDEREVMLAGRSAKATMLTTLAVLLFAFCLSCFQISYYRLPPEQAVDGKTRAVELGLKFELIDRPQQAGAEDGRQNIVAYTGLPVSNSALILGLIAWQIAAYNYSLRRLTK